MELPGNRERTREVAPGLDIVENFFIKRTVKPWHRLPRAVVESIPRGV